MVGAELVDRLTGTVRWIARQTDAFGWCVGRGDDTILKRLVGGACQHPEGFPPTPQTPVMQLRVRSEHALRRARVHAGRMVGDARPERSSCFSRTTW